MQVFRCDAVSRVADSQSNVSAGFQVPILIPVFFMYNHRVMGHINAPAPFGHGMGCVCAQVDDDLMDLGGVNPGHACVILIALADIDIGGD